jgi:ABC-type enterochelin transport system permease subunit
MMLCWTKSTFLLVQGATSTDLSHIAGCSNSAPQIIASHSGSSCARLSFCYHIFHSRYSRYEISLSRILVIGCFSMTTLYSMSQLMSYLLNTDNQPIRMDSIQQESKTGFLFG